MSSMSGTICSLYISDQLFFEDDTLCIIFQKFASELEPFVHGIERDMADLRIFIIQYFVKFCKFCPVNAS